MSDYFGYNLNTIKRTEERDNANLLVRLREEVAPELLAATESDACLTWAEYKWAFYHWKYNRDIATTSGNESVLEAIPELYFTEPDTTMIRSCP